MCFFQYCSLSGLFNGKEEKYENKITRSGEINYYISP